MKLLPALTLSLVLAAGTACSGSSTGSSENFPERPITLIVPFDAGGSSDLTARAIAPKLEEALGQPVNIVNNGAAGGVAGLTEVMNAKPDGYTVGVAASGQFSVTPLETDVPYEIEDFAGYMNLVDEANMLTADADSSISSAEELLSTSEEVTYGHSAALLDLLQARLFTDAGVDAAGVPFSSGGESITGLLGGNVDVIAQSLVAGVPIVEGGKARFLATFAPERVEGLDNVPTLAELGYDSVSSVARKFIVLPVGVDDAVVERFSEAIEEAMDSEDYQQFVDSSYGTVPDGDDAVTGDSLRSALREELETYTKWFDELGLSN